jgi:hypothetical protein
MWGWGGGLWVGGAGMKCGYFSIFLLFTGDSKLIAP